jgi:antitoxin VapB
MALNIKNGEVERLAAEVGRLAGESKTEAIRRALEERRSKLLAGEGASRGARLLRFLQSEVWPTLPLRRMKRLEKAEEEAILGFGPDGV